MRLISWNVNGIRAVMKKGFTDVLDELDADFVCIQETKAQPKQIELYTDNYPYLYINSAKRKGYSGTMILCKKEPLSVKYGMDIHEFDDEGRVITLEYSKFYLVTVYTPTSGDGLIQMEVQAMIGIIMKVLQKIQNGSSIIRQTFQRMHRGHIL